MNNREQTFLMIKPDGVVKGLTGEIIRRVEQRGLKIVALKMFQPTREQIDGHYPKTEVWIRRLGEKSQSTYEKYGMSMEEMLGSSDTLVVGHMVREWLMEFMTAGPVVTIGVEGLHAVDMVRKLVGQTIPAFADVGTIRGDFSVDSPALANFEKRAISNLVHASETPEEAKHELGYWLKPEDFVQYERGEFYSLLSRPKKTAKKKG